MPLVDRRVDDVRRGAHARADHPGLRVAVVGAGMSGILCAIKLREAGFDDFVVYEKADRLGGTWRENTYPGITCDVPSHLYSYSFAPNPDWSRHFAPGAEIEAYFEDVARRWDVVPRVRFGTEITRAEYAGGRWRLATSRGPADEADVVIAATGVLHHPSVPKIPGLDAFAGAAFHSARWDHGVPLEGKRVGVIGTGSSAVQIVGALVDRVGELVLFQRTPQWIAPVDNPAYADAERAAFRAHPEQIVALRTEMSRALTDGFANHLADVDSPQLRAIHDVCVANLENSVRDPLLREQLRPTYRAACKRLIMSDSFYTAIQRPNARLVVSGIERVEPGGVRTRDGRLHALDVLVLATGFGVDRFMRPMTIVGRDGVRLDDVWRDGPFAYQAVAIPRFPNLFMLNGPNGPVGNFSLIEVAELQMAYILALIETVRAQGRREASPSDAAMARFDAERRTQAERTIWNSGCRSWYLDASGLPTAWPWTFDRFREEMAAPRLADYDIR
jgi:cation diffusion facilitator CzcD-associated flavoprotein CzcO